MRRSRRALLASLATATLAGCTGDDGTNATRTTTGQVTSGPEPEQPSSVDADWPMPAADPGRSNANLDIPGPTTEIAELWHVTSREELSGPVLADGTLYVGDEDHATLRAFDARDGTEQWTESVGSDPDTPWVVDERILVQTNTGFLSRSLDGQTEHWEQHVVSWETFLPTPHGVYHVSNGELVKRSLADGSEQWRSGLGSGETPPSWTEPLFASDEVVYVPTGTHEQVPWQFDPADGTSLGDTDLRESGRGNHFPGERCYRDGTVYASDPFYGDLWTFTATADAYERSWSGGVGDGGGELLAANEERVFAWNRADERFTGISTTGGSDWFSDPIGEPAARPVVTGETVLVHTGDRLYCFDPADGTRLWDRSADRIGTEFVVADDMLFTTDGTTLRAFRAV